MKNIIKLIGIFTLMSSASIMAAEGNYETIAMGDGVFSTIDTANGSLMMGNVSGTAVITNGATAGACDNAGRLIGVMNLAAPVVVTSETIQVLFNFDLTNQGSQFFDTGGVNNDPDEYGSGPFSGAFTIISN